MIGSTTCTLVLSPVHTVAENSETTATVAEFDDSRTFLRQCGQAFTLRYCKSVNSV